jgi:type 1 fimbria pilin
VDSYGTALATVRMKGIYIKNTSTHTITVGAGTTPVTTLLNSTGTLTLPAGAWFAAATPDATGWVVTPSTAMLINFTGTTTDTFQIVVLGGKT